MNSDFEIKFYGVRGSYPICNKQVTKYGGNTSCVLIKVGDKTLIFDCGTGVIELGEELKDTIVYAYIFNTHMHYDHIQGLPFFKPAFNEKNTFEIYSKMYGNISLNEELEKFVTNPMFPYNFTELRASMNFINIKNIEAINIGDDIRIECFENFHPNGSVSYKILYKNKSVCYITDNEITQQTREELINFIKDSDIAIIDSMYNEVEYESTKGWGHSTWESVVNLAKDANVKKLFLFHHNPLRTDIDLDIQENLAQKILTNTYCAKEGEIVRI